MTGCIFIIPGSNTTEVFEAAEHPLDDGATAISFLVEGMGVFAEIARVLKPGGQMLISDVIVDSLPDWMRERKFLYSACVPGAIDEAAYAAGLHAAGLIEIEVRNQLGRGAAPVCGRIAPEIPAAEGNIRSARIYAGKPFSVS